MRAPALVAVVLALVALLSAVPAAASPPSEDSIEVQLVCPTCHETLDESNSPVARQMKELIRKRIAQGWSEKRILDEMVAEFGPSVLSTPARHGFDLLAWLLPIGGACAGAVGLGAGAVYWARRRDDARAAGEGIVPGLGPELERRVDEELARFDG